MPDINLHLDAEQREFVVMGLKTLARELAAQSQDFAKMTNTITMAPVDELSEVIKVLSKHQVALRRLLKDIELAVEDAGRITIGELAVNEEFYFDNDADIRFVKLTGDKFRPYENLFTEFSIEDDPRFTEDAEVIRTT